MIRKMVSNRAGECPECGGPWNTGALIYFNLGDWNHYYDSEQCAAHAAERVVVPVDAQMIPVVKYMPATAEIAVNEATTRDRAIHEAHMENMAANAELVRTIQHLTAALDRIAKWLTDDALANRGLKL
jgi:hypothetical protein